MTISDCISQTITYDAVKNASQLHRYELVHEKHFKSFRKEDSARVFGLLDSIRDFSVNQKDVKTGISTQICEAYFRITRLRQLDIPERILNQALESAISIESQYHIAIVSHYLGMNHYIKDEYKEAIHLLLKADYIMNRIGYARLWKPELKLFRIAQMYLDFKNYPRSRDYARRSLSLIKDPDTSKIAFANYNLLGISNVESNIIDSAITYFSLARENAICRKDSILYGAVLLNIGILEFEEQKIDQAYSTISKALTINEKNNVASFHVSSLIQLGKIQIELGMLDDAKKNIPKAYDLMKQRNADNPNAWLTYYETCSMYYKRVENHKRANAYLDSMIAYEDSVDKVMDLGLIANLGVQVASEKYESDLQLLEERERFQKARIDLLSKNHRLEQNIRNIVIVSSFVILIIMFFIWRMSIKRKKEEKQRLYEEYEMAKVELDRFRASIRDKNALIESFRYQLENNTKNGNGQKTDDLVVKLEQSNILTEADWLEFKRNFSKVFPGFTRTLESKFPNLTAAELRLMVLIKLGFSIPEMSSTLGILPESVRKTRSRVMKKVDANNSVDLKRLVETI